MSSKESEDRVLSSIPAASGAKSESVRSGGCCGGAIAGWGPREAAAVAGASDGAAAASTATAFAAAALSLDCLLVVTLHAASEEDPGVAVAVEKALPKGEGRAPNRTQFGVAMAASASRFSQPFSLLLAGGVALGAAWRILVLLLLGAHAVLGVLRALGGSG